MRATIEQDEWECMEMTPNTWCKDCGCVWFPKELTHADTCKCGGRCLDWNEICDEIDAGRMCIGPRRLCRTGLMYRQ